MDNRELEPAAWMYSGPYDSDGEEKFVADEYVEVWNPVEPLVRVSDVKALLDEFREDNANVEPSLAWSEDMKEAVDATLEALRNPQSPRTVFVK